MYISDIASYAEDTAKLCFCNIWLYSGSGSERVLEGILLDPWQKRGSNKTSGETLNTTPRFPKTIRTDT